MTLPLDDVIITIDDIRKAGHCARGAKNWFDQQGLDFRDFLKNGITATQMLATGDAQGEQVVVRKIERELVGVDLTGVTITVDESRASGRCVLGSRQFAAAYGLDFERFLSDGIDAAALLATGDPEALAMVRYKVRHAHG